MSLYRDPLATLRSEIAAKRIVLAERERELPPLLRAMAPQAFREKLDALRARVASDERSHHGRRFQCERNSHNGRSVH